MKFTEEINESYTMAEAIKEAQRCLQCKVPQCKKGCPISNDIPDWIHELKKGNLGNAISIIRTKSNLPAVCGRVCAHEKQCEGNCVLGKKGQPVSIGKLERFVADWHRHNTAEEASAASESEKKQKKVAVIGSGPAGIACAGKLADKGYAVTIFEKAKKAGGVLSYGIPEFRLPREIVDTELEKLQKTGVVINTEKELGRDIGIDSIMEQGFDAVFIGNGAGKSIRLGIPGQELKGVLPASGFLYDANIRKEYPKAEKIAVIGGGNVAMDACRAAARVPGVQKVYVVYRRSMAEMPSDPKELREAVAEGVEFIYLTGPVEVVGDGEKAVGLKCQKMELAEPDASGRRKPVPIPGSEFVLEVDCIIEAIGSESDNDGFGDLEKSSRGYITTDPDTFATSRPGVFAGGDTVTGPKTVIAAMGAGIKAAESIADYLEKLNK